MKKRIFLFLLSATFLVGIPTSSYAAKKTDVEATLYGPLAKDTLEDVHTINTIGDDLYLIDHVERGTYTEKRLYRLSGKNIEDLELVYAAEGSVDEDDYITQFAGNLYWTVTGDAGKRIRVYRSGDNGETWKVIDKIGIFEAGVRNTILDTFTTGNRLYFVIEPGMIDEETADPEFTQELELWSTADGTTWNTQTLRKNNPQYAGYTIVDNDPYIFVNMQRATSGDEKHYSSAVFTPKSPTATKFRQLGQTNYHNKLLVREVTQVATHHNTAFLRGYISGVRRDGESINRKSNLRSLRSVNGARWKKAGGKLVKYISHNDALFALTKGKDGVQEIYISSDGSALQPTTLSFQNDFTIEPGSLNMYGSADDSLLLVSFRHLPTSGDPQNRCLASPDGVTWTELLCGIPEKTGTQQIVKKGNVWYFVRGREKTSYRLYKLSYN